MPGTVCAIAANVDPPKCPPGGGGITIGAWEAAAGTGSGSVGFGVPHILHLSLEENTKSPQLGHNQSPGFVFILAAFPLGAPQCLQVVLCEKFALLQLVHCQSPGLVPASAPLSGTSAAA